MKTYHVHFSFYSEESGQFDDSFYAVDAENPFEARRMAWAVRDTDDEAKFQSCVKQSGVVWDASPLDLADYFNSQAAYDKYKLKYIENVCMQNAKIKNNADEASYQEKEKYQHYGSLWTIQTIARDIGKPLGMEPPTVYEEIEYACRLVDKLDEIGEHEKAFALMERINEAKKWDNGAIHDLKGLFNHDGIHLPGDYVHLPRYFGRDGVFPERADVDEREYKYIKRWTEARRVETLARLPMLGEKDIIKKSENMPFDHKVLVLRHDALTPEYRKPENILWTPRHDADGICLNLDNRSPNTRFNVENMITGIVAALRFKDFSGVLRPEYADNINFDTLKQEYAAQQAAAGENGSGTLESPEFNEAEDWEMEE